MAARADTKRERRATRRLRRVRAGTGWLLAAAAWLVLLAFALVAPWLWPASEPERTPAAPVTASAAAEPAPPEPARTAPAPVKRDVPVRPPSDDSASPELPEPEPAPSVAPEAEPIPESEPEPVDEAPTFEFSESPYGVPGGLAAFPPIGDQKLQRGIVVPESFPVPEGFVKHYQVTDDGEPLPPILMFHPDYELLDENGEPIELPANRVVPPELAPEGLPIEILELPDEQE